CRNTARCGVLTRSTMIPVNKVLFERVFMNLRLWVWGIAVGVAILLGVPAVAAPSAIKISQGGSQQSGGNAAAAAERAFKEGDQLYQQGTAESLRKAIAKFEEALKLYREAGDRSGEATTLSGIGNVYSDLGEQQKALEYLSQSLTLIRAVGDRDGEATTLYNIANAKRDLGNLTEALTNIESSLKIIESLRTKVASPELRTSYFATVQNYYQFYIDLLMQLHKTQPKFGYDTKAFEASERSRARSLLELLQEANADIRQGVAPDLLQKERNLQQQLDAQEKRRIEVLNRPNHTPAQEAELEQQRQTLLAQYQDIQTQIRTTSPRYAALTQPQPLTLPQIQQQILDENTILLQYSLGKDRSYLWAVTKTNITSYELPTTADIETIARKFRDAVTAPSSRNSPDRVAQANDAISQIILQPVAAQLGQKRLLIVGDRVLNYLPFAALSLPVKSGKNGNPLATHGLVNSTHPELSGVILSLVDEKGNPLNGFLRLTDIFNLKLAANLVVLSACQTGLGQNIQGEGMVGLTRGFMYAGAQRVVVSLWSVDDEGTATLMSSFYQGMLQKGLTPAAALRAAQLELWKQEKWHSPYYWVAFTLQGEWR
ncbi:MAG: CHAT domain-containing protein, partial [Oscillatoriales cyanobacterium]